VLFCSQDTSRVAWTVATVPKRPILLRRPVGPVLSLQLRGQVVLRQLPSALFRSFRRIAELETAPSPSAPRAYMCRILDPGRPSSWTRLRRTAIPRSLPLPESERAASALRWTRANDGRPTPEATVPARAYRAHPKAGSRNQDPLSCSRRAVWPIRTHVCPCRLRHHEQPCGVCWSSPRTEISSRARRIASRAEGCMSKLSSRSHRTHWASDASEDARALPPTHRAST
jgi:hypothetical protein